MSAKEVVIVGGGVFGCGTAYYLAKQGIHSQIIERDSVASQASGRAWAVFGQLGTSDLFEGFGVPDGTSRTKSQALYRPPQVETLEKIAETARELKEEGGMDIQYGDLPCIYTVLQENEEKFLKRRVQELQSEGVEAKWVGADEVRAEFPDIHPAVRGGICLPGAQCESYRYTLALAQAAERKGADIRQGDVVGFKSKGSKVTSVTLSSGTEVGADVVVLATGPWLKDHTSWLGKEIPIKPFKMEVLKVEMPDKLPWYRLGIGEITFIPKVDGSVLVGDGPLVSGMVIPAADGKVEPGLPSPYDWQPEFDDSPTEYRKMRYTEDAILAIPRMEKAKLSEHRAGLLIWLPNKVPITMGRLPGWDNVYVVAALFGIKCSIAVCRLMVELITKGHSEEDMMNVLDPARCF